LKRIPIIPALLAPLLIATIHAGGQPDEAGQAADPPDEHALAVVAILEAHVPEAARAEPNAWPLLTEAIGLHDRVFEAFAQTDATARAELDAMGYAWEIDVLRADLLAAPRRAGGAGATAREAERLRRLAGPGRALLQCLDEEGLFRILDRLAAAQRVVPPAESALAAPDISIDIRLLASACLARMHEAPDAETYAEAFGQALALGRIGADRGTIDAGIDGFGIRTQALDAVIGRIARGELDAAWCGALAETLDRQSHAPSVVLALETQRLVELRWLDAHYSRQAAQGHPNAAADGIEGRIPPRALVRDAFNSRMDALIALAREPCAARLPGGVVEPWDDDLHVLDVMIPPVRSILRQADREAIDRAGLRVMLALELWRLEHGEFTPRLEDLVPGMLDRVPTDPCTGGPLGYRLIDAKGATPIEAYVLYSAGRDRTNDQGRATNRAPLRALSPAGAASDYVINRPRSGR
jgi:hypothetical protein